MPSRIHLRRMLALFLLLGPLALLSACAHGDLSRHQNRGHGKRVHAGHGPPPHAPAHGYRHQLRHHHGIELVYDSGVGVYAVEGHPEHFFWNDQFYRWHHGRWQISARFDHGWISIAPSRLPKHLARKHKGRGHSKPHPAKHGHR